MIRSDLENLYWFWSKTQIKNKKGEVNSRTILQFEMFLKILVLTMKYNGQSKAEFNKNFKRVNDIFAKSLGDVNKAITLSQTQANRISDEFKAINRSMCAKELYNDTKNEIYIKIFEVFFQRAYELGSVSKQDYRSYKLEKLGII